MNKNYGYSFNLRRLSISESGEEYEEGEPDINPETDPEKEFQEREFNPDEDYEWEDEYNPDEDYDWGDEYNPDEDYDWGDEYNPDEDYDWGDEYNPDEDYDWGDDKFEPVKDPPDNENDYESNLSREGTETILSPSENPEEQLERVIDSESQNISEQNLQGKPEEIDEFELITPEGKAEKPAEPPEIIELMEEGSYNSDYASEQEPEFSPDIEPMSEHLDHPEQEFLNESEDKPKEELEKELELINPETGEPVPRQPDWEFIPLQDYLEQLNEQQENRDKVQEIEPEQELEKIPDQESELISEHYLENISDKKSEKSFDQKSELIQEPESEKILKHNQGETYKTDHLKEKDSITDPKELKESKHHEYQDLIKTKYEPIFSQIELRKSQKKSKKSDKITEISQKTKKKSRAEESKEINLKNNSTLAEKKEKRHKIEVDYSSEQIQHISKNRPEKYEELETSEILEVQKQEKLKDKQKREFASKELLELQERYRQETGKRPIYNKEKTKGFKEWLESQKEYTLIKTDSNRKSEIREEWELFLKQWINEANETEVSKEIKEELLNIIRKYHQSREIYWRLLHLSEKKELTRKKIEEIKILIEKLEETTSIQKKIFKNLRAFRAFYNENIRWYKHKIIAEKHKFLKHLSQKLNYLKEVKNPQKNIKQNWKELLKENLYKNTTLILKEKPLINKILQKEEFTEDDKKELISLLIKLPTEDLVLLLGAEFKQPTKNYIKWGWDYNQGVKRVMLKNFLSTSNHYKKEISEALRLRNIKKIKKFPKKSRLIISLAIYNKMDEFRVLQLQNFVKFLISSLKSKQNKLNWVKKIPNHELNYLNKLLFDKNQILALKLYLIDLIKLIYDLNSEKLRQKKAGNIFNIKYFVSKLSKNNNTLGLSQRTLLSFISELIDYLNEHSDEFNMNKLSFQSLYDDGKKKECGQCHKIKDYIEFNIKENNLLESRCKKCRLEEGAIRYYKKKIKIILRLLGLKSKIKCEECMTDISRLSALEFHHKDKTTKKVNLGDIFNMNLNHIVEIIKRENLTLLCANCHSKKQALVFKKFENLILKNDIFKNTPIEIDKIINNYLKTFPDLKKKSSSKISSFKTQIKRWLKKRYIIEEMYNGKCIGCGEITVRNNLPSFDFHHRNENTDEQKSKWTDIKKYDIQKIRKMLREEDCIALCSNCHKIITHFRFIKHIDEIFEKKYENYKKKVKSGYKNIIDNIKNFKFKDEIIGNPLKKQISYGEGWKKYIKAIYEITKLKNSNQFTSNELVSYLDLSVSAVNKYLHKLIKKGLIELYKESEKTRIGKLINGATSRIYRINNLGLEQAKFLIVSSNKSTNNKK